MYFSGCAHQVLAVSDYLFWRSEPQRSAMYVCLNIKVVPPANLQCSMFQSIFSPQFFIKSVVWILVGKLTRRASRSTTPRPLICIGEATTALRTVRLGSLKPWTAYGCGSNRQLQGPVHWCIHSRKPLILCLRIWIHYSLVPTTYILELLIYMNRRLSCLFFMFCIYLRIRSDHEIGIKK